MPTWWQEITSWWRTFIRNLLSRPLRIYEPVQPREITKEERDKAAKEMPTGLDRCKTYILDDPSYKDALVQRVQGRWWCCPTGYTPVEVDGKVICRKG